MKIWRYAGVIGIVMALCLFISGDSAAAAMEKYGYERESIAYKYEALSAVNTVRSAMGLVILKNSTVLNEMAQSHSQYMEDINTVSFEELRDSEYYTGAYPMDRGMYFGYDKKYVVEYDQRRMTSYLECIEWCIQDPYVRNILLHPGYTEIGFGKSGSYYALEAGGDGHKGESAITVYPYAGQQNVGAITKAELSKIPEGLGLTGGKTIGIPITVQYYNEKITDVSFRNIRAVLKDTRSGEEIQMIAVTAEEDPWVRDTLILFPTQKYRANTGYAVSVKMDVWYNDVMLESIEERWTFTSAGSESLGEVNRKQAIMSLAQALEIPVETIEEAERKYEFKDIDPKDKEYSLLYKLKEDGVLSEAEKNFYPMEFTTREQVAVWLVAMIRAYAPQVIERVELSYKDTFEDINQCSEEAREAVQIAYQLNLIEDQGRGIFNPQISITQAEMDALIRQTEKIIHIAWQDSEENP